MVVFGFFNFLYGSKWADVKMKGGLGGSGWAGKEEWAGQDGQIDKRERVPRTSRAFRVISPPNVAVDIGQTLKPDEYFGMVRREVLDAYLRDLAASAGATIINGLFVKMDKPSDKYAPYAIHYNAYDGKVGSAGKKVTVEVDAVIGANSREAKLTQKSTRERMGLPFLGWCLMVMVMVMMVSVMMW
ncbi:hypothetical protein L1987_37364 [Smallanthus sonchifolius]|uniref:Uncharacterized protein n=1 Tax=Smallanthus sonchifolius TaxID=185202 RepID=A0ACB9HH08_9ASTR|nr:hypothetical protein L1987_37364 [Smallanthus sonchifolius]